MARKIVVNDGSIDCHKRGAVPCHNLVTALYYRDCAPVVFANGCVNYFPEANNRAPYFVVTL